MERRGRGHEPFAPGWRREGRGLALWPPASPGWLGLNWREMPALPSFTVRSRPRPQGSPEDTGLHAFQLSGRPQASRFRFGKGLSEGQRKRLPQLGNGVGSTVLETGSGLRALAFLTTPVNSLFSYSQLLSLESEL